VLSNVASTLVSGSADITNNSSDFKNILATGSVNKPLNIEAKMQVVMLIVIFQIVLKFELNLQKQMI
jgi:hypothetical protein